MSCGPFNATKKATIDKMVFIDGIARSNVANIKFVHIGKFNVDVIIVIGKRNKKNEITKYNIPPKAPSTFTSFSFNIIILLFYKYTYNFCIKYCKLLMFFINMVLNSKCLTKI